ncbi:beta-ketoacyl reductase, partial [Millisia brevis]|uniref:beta-ketoacyl reductase n=1 Tax=Millisia brevis TaxID=264148 RepID=UPI0012ECBD22
ARPGVARLVAAWEPPARKSIGAPRTLRVVDPTGDHGDWVALFAESARRFGATIHDSPDAPADTLLWAIPRGGEPADAVKQITAYLSDLAIGTAPAGIDRVVIATLGAEHIGDDPLPSVFSAGAAVAVESLVAEWSGMRCVRLDLPATPPTAADAAAAMAAIHTVGERDFAIREGVVHVQRLRRADLPTDRTPVGSAVVIGGTGRLGLAYARRLIDRGARAVTLVNRGGPRPEQATELADLRAGGATVEVVGCDITDPAAVAAFVRGRTEPIDLLVHAAVDYVHGRSAALDAAAVHRALAAKVDGLRHLLDGSAIGPGTTVDLCSSVSATFTGPGLAGYAAGNRMLDAIAPHLRAGGVHCRSVRWGVFGDPDAGTDAYRALVADAAGAGLLDLTPDEAFDAGVTAAVDEDCLVLRADWETLARVCELQGRPRLLPDPVCPDALPAPSVPATPSAAPPATPSAARPAAEAADPVEVLPAILRSVLGLEPDEPIDRTMPLVGLGVDSLQALDLNRMLLGALGRDIPATTLLSGASVDDLIDVLRSPPAGG